MKIKGIVDIKAVNIKTGVESNIHVDNLVFNDQRHWVCTGGNVGYHYTGTLTSGYLANIYLSSSTSTPTRTDPGTIQSNIYAYALRDVFTQTRIDDYTMEFYYGITNPMIVTSTNMLRVLGLRMINFGGGGIRYSSSIITATKLSVAVEHTPDTYVYVQYRLRATLDPAEYVYNIREATHIDGSTYYHSNIGCYRKYWDIVQQNNSTTATYFSGDGRYMNVFGCTQGVSFAKSDTQLFAGAYRNRNSSFSAFTNGYRPTISRVFAHLSSVSNYIFFDSNAADIPESYGTLTVNANDIDHDDIYVPFAVRINYTNDGGSGAVGDISYNIDVYPNNYTASFGSGFLVFSGNVGGYFGHTWTYKHQTAVSCNRKYVAFTHINYATTYDYSLVVGYYQGVNRSFGRIPTTPIDYTPKPKTLCVMNDGTIMWGLSTTGKTGVICKFSNIDDMTVDLSTDIEEYYDLDADFGGDTLIIYHMFADTIDDGSSGAPYEVVWILTNHGLLKMTYWGSGTPIYTVYNDADLSISMSDFVPRDLLSTNNSIWSFQARNGVVLWIKPDSLSFVYWDSKIGGNALTFTESTGWSTTILDIVLSYDGMYVGYTSTEATNNKLRIREPNSAWATRTDMNNPYTNGFCRLGTDINSIFAVWRDNGARTYFRLYTINTLDWTNYLSATMERDYAGAIWSCADRSMLEGCPYGTFFWQYDSLMKNYIATAKVHYGWDGSEWVIGHTGSRVTHADARYIPHNISLAFNDATPPNRSFRVEDYYAFYAHPSGWIKDNLEELSIADTLYSWNTHLTLNEAHTIPVGGGNITVSAKSDPNFWALNYTIYCNAYFVRLQSDPSVVFTRYFPTSDSNVALGKGTKTFTTQAGLGYVNGEYIEIRNLASTGLIYMTGTVSSYSGTTLIVTVTGYNGSAGNYSGWWFTPPATPTLSANQYYINPTNGGQDGTIKFHIANAGDVVLIDYMWCGYEW